MKTAVSGSPAKAVDQEAAPSPARSSPCRCLGPRAGGTSGCGAPVAGRAVRVAGERAQLGGALARRGAGWHGGGPRGGRRRPSAASPAARPQRRGLRSEAPSSSLCQHAGDRTGAGAGGGGVQPATVPRRAEQGPAPPGRSAAGECGTGQPRRRPRVCAVFRAPGDGLGALTAGFLGELRIFVWDPASSASRVDFCKDAVLSSE